MKSIPLQERTLARLLRERAGQNGKVSPLETDL